MRSCGTIGDGKATIITAFTESCNTAFANIGMQLGSATLKSMAEKYGMNDPNLKIPTPVVQSNFPLEPDSGPSPRCPRSARRTTR